MVEKIPSWIERILLPSLNEIRGELKAVNSRIDSLNFKVDSLEKIVNAKFEAIEERLLSLRNEMDAKFKALEERFNVVYDIAVLKAEVKELREKISVKS
ncbi:MAG: hypothetical protein ACUVTD_05775 [Nitrososphaerales archaeon]